ncbi:MAG TPA: NapC/NirT family cytochrome c [Candidatus Sulfotelmatobacter sp.]|nr:NapC/NirT family cytochrome c [Candidatus Sulfotelmatobacter sp.]
MDTEKTPPPAVEPWHRSRMLLRNPVSLAGVALGIVSLANIFIFFLIDQIATKASPYIGILAYMASPGFLILGLLLMLAGMLLERRKHAAPSAFYPRIDLNDRIQRSAVISFLTFLLVFVVVSAAGSYKAYEFTESTSFCGQLCHTVMIPEYTAYQLSPHARVACAECHVGAGATWFVKSKLSGSRQVFATIFNTYPRPIPSPVRNLRPAQETCEQCHWPKKFYGGQLKVFSHYGSDEKNTLFQIRMLIKTGGGDPATGAPEGIHWHMNIGNKIDYVAADDKRQIIPYIHVEDLQGRITEYYAKDSSLSKDQIAKSPRHHMDCVDCHNRPTHIYVPPD